MENNWKHASQTPTFLWRAEVRDYELDYQGIVNNAQYFNYFSYARVHLLKELGISVPECAQKQLNIVLLKTCIDYVKSMRYGDAFVVTSTVFRVSKFKLLVQQEIRLNSDNVLIARGRSIVACIDHQGKPHLLDPFRELLISQQACGAKNLL